VCGAQALRLGDQTLRVAGVRCGLKQWFSDVREICALLLAMRLGARRVGRPEAERVAPFVWRRERTRAS
jgi:hypothetical protein